MQHLDSIRLDRIFLDRALSRPDAIAVVVGDRSWTREQLHTMARQATARLAEAGVAAGDRVLAQYTTDAEDLAIAVAVSGLGATLIPAPTSLGGLELTHIIGLAAAKVVVSHGDLPRGTVVPAGVRVVDIAQVVAGEGDDLGCALIGPDHTAVIGVTSGSTGLPKGVMHTWPSIHYAATHAADVVRIRDGEAICTPGASAGAPGYASFTYLGLAHGATIVRAEKWNADVVLDLMEKHRVVWSMTVVTMMHMFVDAARKRSTPTGSLGPASHLRRRLGHQARADPRRPRRAGRRRAADVRALRVPRLRIHASGGPVRASSGARRLPLRRHRGACVR